ncbi:hypothetical protein B0I35DRAFT_98915 [Stachybotrys elegans]|uniref:BTB domain-containing protein n=1 Tax=Stachybotrys elegans TaxID=80388 RepID=A0A8K0SHZ8_9HYPO|nr:hypothetical protein B0I35DRAFT_98915 [Stachybotrys elegans]
MGGTEEDTLQLRHSAQTERIILCPDGDAFLVVAGSDKSVEREFLVSSTVLGLASDYFKALFTSGFKEGRETRSGICPRIPLKGDDPEAMLVLLSILHFQNLADNDTVELRTLEAISIVCDKYDCIKALRPWIPLWLGNYKDAKLEDLGSFMSAAYHFRDSDALRRISSMAICHFNTDIELPWPKELFGAVEKQSKKLLSDLHTVLQTGESLTRCYAQGHKPDGPVCLLCRGLLPRRMSSKPQHLCARTEFHDSYYTIQSLVGEYFAALREAQLWPSTQPFQSSTAACIVQRFGSAARTCRDRCSTRTCPLRATLEHLSKMAEQMLRDARGITLEELS